LWVFSDTPPLGSCYLHSDMKSYFLFFIVALVLSSGSLMAKKGENILLDGAWVFCPSENIELSLIPTKQRCHSIDIPGGWESVSPEYNGFGLLETQFEINDNIDPRILGLSIVRIRDADKTYVNGHLIGETGEFPPPFSKRSALFSTIPNSERVSQF